MTDTIELTQTPACIDATVPIGALETAAAAAGSSANEVTEADMPYEKAPTASLQQKIWSLWPEATWRDWHDRLVRAKIHTDGLRLKTWQRQNELNKKKQEQARERNETPPPDLPPPSEYSDVYWHRDPGRPLMYGGIVGGSRAPVVLMESASEELARYLRYDPLGPFQGGILEWTYSTHWKWEDWGFAEDVKEQVFKADWHAIPSAAEEVEVFVPRLAKRKLLKRAPPRIEAFAEAFRAVNRETWSIIVDTMMACSAEHKASGRQVRSGPDPLILLGETFAEEHGHFGSVEAQVRWGTGSLQLPSHVDGATSLIHLGLTLGGERTLRAGLFFSAGEVARTEKDVLNKKLWPEENLKDTRMTPGKAYISSPYAYEHAVLYSETNHHDPVIALMFRIAFKDNIGPLLNDLRDDERMRTALRVISGALHMAAVGQWLRMPTIEEVRSAEARIAATRRRLSRGVADAGGRKLMPAEARVESLKNGVRLHKEVHEQARVQQMSPAADALARLVHHS